MRGRVTRSLHAFASVVRNPDLRRLQAAFVTFGLAEAATWVAIIVFAYQRGGAVAAGLVAALQLVPAAIFAPVASVLGDRFRRDRVLRAAYLIQAAAMAATGAALFAEAPIPLVYALAAIAAATITLTRPVQGAILPALARTPDELTAANAVAGTIETATMLVGPALAGLLLGLQDAASVFAVMAAGLLLGAILVARIEAPSPAHEPGAGSLLADSGRTSARSPC